MSLVSVALCTFYMLPKPAGKPGNCWTRYTGPMRNREKRTQIENECISVSCYRSVAEIQLCGYFIGGDNRTTEVDYSKPYPECCPKPLGKVVSGIL